MADYTVKKVGEFPAAISFNAEDVLFVEQYGKAKKLSGELLQEFCQAAISALVERAETAANDAEAAKNAIVTLEVESSTLKTGEAATVTAELKDGKYVLSFGLPKGAIGEPGADGASIQSIERTAGTGASGTTDTYTVTLTDGSKTTFQVYNGKDGEGAGDMTAAVYDPQNKQTDVFKYVDNAVSNIDVEITADEVTFADGETFQQKYDSGELTGAPGYTPVKGTDYFTAEDKTEIVNDVLAALPAAEGASF